MKMHEMEAKLFCIQCNEETEHIILYINNEITSVKCEDCQREVGIKVDIMKEFYKELYEHISTKPTRLSEEYKQDLSKFLSRLPIRIISKPYRLIRYLNESRKIIKKYKS